MKRLTQRALLYSRAFPKHSNSKFKTSLQKELLTCFQRVDHVVNYCKRSLLQISRKISKFLLYTSAEALVFKGINKTKLIMILIVMIIIYVQDFDGNQSREGLKINPLDPPIVTTIIRIYPKKTFSAYKQTRLKNVQCLRLGLKGCSAPGGSQTLFGRNI